MNFNFLINVMNFFLELQNYVVVVRVMKVGESEVSWFSEFSNNSSNEYQSLAKMAKIKVDNAYM